MCMYIYIYIYIHRERDTYAQIELYWMHAPRCCKNFLELAKRGCPNRYYYYCYYYCYYFCYYYYYYYYYYD